MLPDGLAPSEAEFCKQFVLVLNEMVLLLVIEESDRTMTSTADG